jgi:hypothetical protein
MGMPQLPGRAGTDAPPGMTVAASPTCTAPTVVSLTEVLTWCEPGLMTTICGVPELPWTDCPALIITEPTVPSIGLRNWA